jgi:GT2 family glycosyltransferase
VIVTYQRHAALCSTLRAMAPLVDPDNGELIVVDQCPDSSLPPEILAIPYIRYIVLDKPGMVNARNIGLGMAKGRIVLFFDDDVIPSDNLIKFHLKAYDNKNVGGVAGRILNFANAPCKPPHPKVFDLVEGWRYAHFDHNIPGDVMTARGCNMSFRRNVLISLGGFDPNLAIFRDDSDMCLRVLAAGYVIRFEPAATLVHLDAPSGGTRGPQDAGCGCLQKELNIYRKCFRHYNDNLYFIVKNFQGTKRIIFIIDAYKCYVGLSRWPWRLVAKNACFFVALLRAARHKIVTQKIPKS